MISPDEKRWQAEADAHTLAAAKVIEKDKARLSAAQEAAARMAQEQADQANAMKSVARKPKHKEGMRRIKRDTTGGFHVFERIE